MDFKFTKEQEDLRKHLPYEDFLNPPLVLLHVLAFFKLSVEVLSANLELLVR